MKLLFKFPTRQRPIVFKRVLNNYYDLMSNNYDFNFLITLDENDITMNNEEIINFMKSKNNLKFVFGESKNKIDAVNRDMEYIKDWDILILVSDDMIPVVKNYDKIIVDNMVNNFPDTDGALHFDDGFLGGDKCITLSIFGKKLYDRFGYIYHPSYKSFYCDNEFTDEVYTLQKVKYIPQVIIKHNWRGDGADALYLRNSVLGKIKPTDEEVYKKRKSLGFPKNLNWSYE